MFIGLLVRFEAKVSDTEARLHTVESTPAVASISQSPAAAVKLLLAPQAQHNNIIIDLK